eukprot:TRINITY_DN8345_c0_g1_i7.p1 TRINITY_DN8345_c0_g1~~TRINITY_DN8345_c0_g1_i7.p1  ORF type:complete len:136 (+),score=28.89 TRINITY_DN8345_c0_g1_i7:51-410(+)
MCIRDSYDITNEESFERAKLWLEEVKENSKEKVCIILMGNKSDCLNEEKVSLETAQAFAETKGIRFSIVSAKDNIGIADVFNDLALQFYTLMKRGGNMKARQVNIRLREKSKTAGKSCC